MSTHKYLPVAISIAQLSKDISTKAGAVILGPDKEVRSIGYNGAPRGCKADEDHRSERPEKLFWFEHAERNAIYNAARVGTPLAGSTMVCTHYPCMDCARAIIQAGIRKVVVPEPDQAFYARWAKDIVRANELFQECGVDVEVLL